MDKKQEFLKRILATFRIEAEENINLMSAKLVELEKGPDIVREKELVEVIYRAAHSLKGAARAVNIVEIESLCHAFEGVMSAKRSEEIELSPLIFDILQYTVDILDEILNVENSIVNPKLNNKIRNAIENLSAIETGEKINAVNTLTKSEAEAEAETEAKIKTEAETEEEQFDLDVVRPIITKEKSSEKITESIRQANKQDKLKPASADTIRISVNKLDKLLIQAEEMLSVKQRASNSTERLHNTADKLSAWNNESSSLYSSIRNTKHFLEKKEKNQTLSKEEKEIGRIIQFYDWSSSHFAEMKKDLSDLEKLSDQNEYSTGQIIDTLLVDVKDLITVSFSSMLDVFPKMIRDIARDLGKEIDFGVIGDSTLIDRRILEKIKQPLLHIIRNSIDYGIEKPEDRIKANKTAKGKINLSIEQLESNKVEILISDDGAGINIKKLKELYIRDNNISKKDIENISESVYLNYIFKSGVSTSDIVTDLSGRGLGLAIVQEAIEQLGGSVMVETKVGKSTSFRIRLPLSLVTFRGVLLSVSENDFIIPTSKIEKVLRLNTEEIKTVNNKATIPFNNEFIPLVSLSDILELPQKENDSQFVQIIILNVNNKQIAYIIDKVIREQEVLVKEFNMQLTRIRNISGATILGSGKVVPILRVADLLKSSYKHTVTSDKITETLKDEKDKQHSVLVVEDSITSRMLLKNILEADGYKVNIAIDGIDGFTKLREGSYDAVVSDVDMPRMNGFELTKKIRAHKDSAEIPVVLVTSLSKREDKERGIDAGANAYIIKSDFDQSNLLEALERLI